MTTAVDTAALDEMFAEIETMDVPEGYRAEIIGGEIVLNPQRKTRSTIIRLFTRSLEEALGRDADILWDVRVDFPGTLNGYAPDVALVARERTKTTGDGTTTGTCSWWWRLSPAAADGTTTTPSWRSTPRQGCPPT